MNQLIEDPIFIVGYMRSGTTLLRRIFRTIPEVFSPVPEVRYFYVRSFLFAKYADLNDDRVLHDYVTTLFGLVTSNPDRTGRELLTPSSHDHYSPEAIDTVLAQAQTLRDYDTIFRLVMDHLMGEAGKSRWVIKAPPMEIPRLVKLFPKAKFIGILRDPRAVLASKKARVKVPESADRAKFDRAVNSYIPIGDALAWKSYTHSIRAMRQHYDQQMYVITYNDLVQEPERHLPAMLSFLDLPWEKEHLFEFHTSSIDKWKTDLSSAEIAMTQALLQSDIKELGLALEPVPFRAWLGMPVLGVRNIYLFIARYARRWRMFGTKGIRYFVSHDLVRMKSLFQTKSE